MFRIKHLMPTAAAVIASAGVLAPAALAQVSGLNPNPAANTKVVRIVDYVQPPDTRLGARVHDTPLANPVELPNVSPQTSNRIVATSGGIDWTFPVMGAVALGLIIMIAGDQILVRRRGQLAT